MVDTSNKDAFITEMEVRAPRVPKSVVRRLYEPFRQLHLALSSCDMENLEVLNELTLSQAAALYGKSNDLRHEFAVEDGFLWSSLPKKRIGS